MLGRSNYPTSYGTHTGAAVTGPRMIKQGFESSGLPILGGVTGPIDSESGSSPEVAQPSRGLIYCGSMVKLAITAGFYPVVQSSSLCGPTSREALPGLTQEINRGITWDTSVQRLARLFSKQTVGVRIPCISRSYSKHVVTERLK